MSDQPSGGYIKQKDEAYRDRWGNRSLTNPGLLNAKGVFMPRNTRPKTPALSLAQPRLTRAERVIAFLEYLPITKGILRGKKMRLLPHQRDFVQRIYPSDVRLASSVARGNGKTGLVAGLVCCHLFGPEAEVRGEIYSAATAPSKPHSSLPRSRQLSRRLRSSNSSASRPPRSGSAWR